MVDVNKVYIFSAFLRSSYFLRFFQKPIILSVIFLFCFVCFFTHRNHFSLPWITDPQSSVLTGGAEQAAITVPADAVDEVWMVVHGNKGLACSHIPDDYEVITA